MYNWLGVVSEVENKVEQLWRDLEETQEVLDEISQYYISVGQSEKQLESNKESDDIEVEFVKAIENAQTYIKAKYTAMSSQPNTAYESTSSNINNQPSVINVPSQVKNGE